MVAEACREDPIADASVAGALVKCSVGVDAEVSDRVQDGVAEGAGPSV